MLLDLQNLFQPIVHCTRWAPELSPAVSTPFIRIINARCLLLWIIIPESFSSWFNGLSAFSISGNQYKKSNRNSCFKFLSLSMWVKLSSLCESKYFQILTQILVIFRSFTFFSILEYNSYHNLCGKLLFSVSSVCYLCHIIFHCKAWSSVNWRKKLA